MRRSNREDYCLSRGDQKVRGCGVGLDMKLPRLKTGDDGTPVAGVFSEGRVCSYSPGGE